MRPGHRLDRIEAQRGAPDDCLRNLVEAVRIERLSRGEPDAIGAVTARGGPPRPPRSVHLDARALALP